MHTVWADIPCFEASAMWTPPFETMLVVSGLAFLKEAQSLIPGMLFNPLQRVRTDFLQYIVTMALGVYIGVDA